MKDSLLRHKKVFAISALLVLIIAGAGYTLYKKNVYDRVSYKMNVRQVPEELRKFALLARTPQGNVGVYAWKNAMYSALSAQNADITSAAFAKDGAAVVITKTSEGLYEVRSGDVVLYSSDAQKRDISLSPDGELIAFAELIGKEANDPASWSVMTLTRAGGTPRAITQGTSPHFLSADVLLVTTPTSLMTVSLTSGKEEAVLEHKSRSAFDTSVLSSDKSVLALKDQGTNAVFVYQIIGSTPFKVSALRTQTLPLGGSFALSNTKMYALRQNPEHTEFVSYDLMDGKESTVYRLFKQFRPLQIISTHE